MMTKTILYIDDSTLFRSLAINSLRDNNYSNLKAPNSIEEFKDMVKANEFVAALIDFDLKEWVGNDYKYVIKIGDAEIHNGIELAEFLLSLNAKVKIGIYSTNGFQLQKKLESSKIREKVEYVPIKSPKEDITKFASDFFDNFFRIKSTIYPAFENNTKMPPEIKSFLAKKILTSLNRGQYVWKAGKYAWLASINNESDDKLMRRSSAEVLYERRQEYEIGLDQQEFQPEYFIDKTSNNMITIKEMLSRITGASNLGINKYIHELFLLKYTTKMYLIHKFSLENLKKVIERLSPLAKFESQKMLFKGFIEEEPISKEEIYNRLEIFMALEAPKILDVYTGIVCEITEKKCAVKLKSISDNKVERVEFFSKEMLDLYNLEEDGEFEYTIYKPSIGGSAYHIEPI